MYSHCRMLGSISEDLNLNTTINWKHSRDPSRNNGTPFRSGGNINIMRWDEQVKEACRANDHMTSVRRTWRGLAAPLIIVPARWWSFLEHCPAISPRQQQGWSSRAAHGRWKKTHLGLWGNRHNSQSARASHGGHLDWNVKRRILNGKNMKQTGHIDSEEKAIVTQHFLKAEIERHIVGPLIFTTTVCVFLVVLHPQTGNDIPPHSLLKGLTRKTCSALFSPFLFSFSRTLDDIFIIQRVNYLQQSFGADQSGACLPGGNSKTRPFYYFFKGQKQRQLLAKRVIRICRKVPRQRLCDVLEYIW